MTHILKMDIIPFLCKEIISLFYTEFLEPLLIIKIFIPIIQAYHGLSMLMVHLHQISWH